MTADSDEGLESSAMDERPSIVHELDQAGNEGGLDAVNLAAGVTCQSVDRQQIRADSAADEAVLALVDFPKQVVIALSVAVNYMKGEQADECNADSRFRFAKCFQASLFLHKSEK